MSFFLVRVNTKAHTNRVLAMRDMAFIIEKRGYWKMSEQPNMPIGSSIIAMGGHGGQGLFLHGIVRKDWKTVKGGAEGNPVYQNKLGVQWEHVVYTHGPGAVAAALSIVNLGALRRHSVLDQMHYRALLHFVLKGEAVNPWEYSEDEDDMEVAA